MASAALRGDLEMFKDICDSDDCSIFISPGVGVEEANLSGFSNFGLFVDMWSWHFCVPRLGCVDAGIFNLFCCGWRGENTWKPSTLHSVP